MLSILLTVAFFRGTTAVACEGDQVEKLISIHGENTCVCYFESIFLTTSIMSSWHAWHDYIQCNVSKNSQSKSGTQLRILSSPHDFIVSKSWTTLSFCFCYEFSNQVLEEGLGGTITSANFPENYEHNTDCSFTIVPVPGNHVAVKVNLVNKKYNALSFTGTMLYIFNVRTFNSMNSPFIRRFRKSRSP